MVGGMPAAVLAYCDTKSFLTVKYAQRAIWEAYENDFGKYATQAQHRHLRKIFQEIPLLIGDHIKYSRIDPELPNPPREIKRAMELLQLAGLLHPVLGTTAREVPLLAGLKPMVFKLLFLDIGLLEQALNLEWGHPGLMAGPLTEQFVGQELLAAGDPLLREPLFFWTREKGSAEVDYLLVEKGSVLPIEVKAGKGGRLKSLHFFLETTGGARGYKLSEQPIQLEGSILSLPLYLASRISHFVVR